MFFTIGHSNRPWTAFVSLLKQNRIDTLVDVRHYPSSKAWPQYNEETMRKELEREGIGYLHLVSLGGRRDPIGEENAGWKVAAFRGYADHMQTGEFQNAIEELLALKGNVCIMCAEAVPWRCHRRLISDYLTMLGHPVHEIISDARPKVHELTRFAKVDGKRLTYPAAERQTTL